MGPTVYAGETFSDGDVIVRCHTPLGGIPLGIKTEGFFDVSQTLSIPAPAATSWTWNSTAAITFNDTADITLN